MHHGIRLEDPYRWLQDRDNPEVIDHLKAENAYTEAVMKQAGDLQEELYKELIGRIEEDSESAPYRKGNYFYKSRAHKGRNYRNYLRKPVNGSDWESYFDAEQEASGQSYFDLGFLDVDPHGNLLAYTIDLEGNEEYTLRFRNLASGDDLPTTFSEVSAEGEWSSDGKVFYFLRETESRRPNRIFRCNVANAEAEPELVYEEPDEQYFAGIYKSQDSAYLFAYSESNETTEIAWLAAGDTNGEFKVLQPRRQNVQYWLEHQDQNWLVRTNEDAPDFKLLCMPVVDSRDQSPVELVPARSGVRLTDVLPLKRHRILFETRDGLDHVRIQQIETGEERELEVADSVYELHAGNNEEYDVDCLQFTYSSPIRPAFTFEVNLVSRERRILKQVRVPSGHDPDEYLTRRVLVGAESGIKVPLTLIHLKELPLDGSAPAYLYAYGAYGSRESVAFNPLWLTWLERGFVVAIAHVRGGGLLGESWYQNGKLSKKQNSFNDFISCAEYLLREGYTSADKLGIEGGSAGGLLVGAVLNQRPDLFMAAVAAVPFVDVVNTMLDPSLPLTTHEYEEWGNPANEEDFLSMLKWSPYENVASQTYPSILVTAGWNDPRVSYWEAAKWVARLRSATTSTQPILLRTDLDSGHAGPSGRYPYLRESALDQAFLISQLMD